MVRASNRLAMRSRKERGVTCTPGQNGGAIYKIKERWRRSKCVSDVLGKEGITQYLILDMLCKLLKQPSTVNLVCSSENHINVGFVSSLIVSKVMC